MPVGGGGERGTGPRGRRRTAICNFPLLGAAAGSGSIGGRTSRAAAVATRSAVTEGGGSGQRSSPVCGYPVPTPAIGATAGRRACLPARRVCSGAGESPPATRCSYAARHTEQGALQRCHLVEHVGQSPRSSGSCARSIARQAIARRGSSERATVSNASDSTPCARSERRSSRSKTALRRTCPRTSSTVSAHLSANLAASLRAARSWPTWLAESRADSPGGLITTTSPWSTNTVRQRSRLIMSPQPIRQIACPFST